jgi:hypothetical protein
MNSLICYNDKLYNLLKDMWRLEVGIFHRIDLETDEGNVVNMFKKRVERGYNPDCINTLNLIELGLKRGAADMYSAGDGLLAI